MSDNKYLEAQRKALKESIEFFAPENKGQREIWVANTFLENLNIQFSESELILVDSDPPDVCFRDARFEVKEIMDPGRRRHDEYRRALEKANVASSASDLVTHFTPKDITLQQIHELVVASSTEHAQKYSASCCRTLDLLFYVNLRDVMGLIETPFPNVTVLRSHPWRSISFVEGYRACVLAASSVASAFIKDGLGKVMHRQNPGI